MEDGEVTQSINNQQIETSREGGSILQKARQLAQEKIGFDPVDYYREAKGGMSTTEALSITFERAKIGVKEGNIKLNDDLFSMEGAENLAIVRIPFGNPPKPGDQAWSLVEVVGMVASAKLFKKVYPERKKVAAVAGIAFGHMATTLARGAYESLKNK